uniref:Charged multivesicular body protein 5 n=1 Tax=Tetraselmis sp. GSL018 TaxID=582737 RepID=A0A061R017_9CHLO|mmetsp:Transcript_15968/g.37863  ORF Transcript_15968/g.37863 Transcript_15968/m.37863 type:complete len:220 (-) Transcript_15968:196-855(-)
MKRIFGTKKEKPPPPSVEDATSSLNNRGDALDEKIKKLDQQLIEHKNTIKRTQGAAKEAAKRRAMNVLKQKRMYESQREQLFQQQFNLENASFTTQAIQDSVTQVQAMQAANTQLKKAFKAKELDINSIEKLQDEMADLMELSNEINETLGQSYGVPEDIDEAELMGELDMLEDELANETEKVGEGQMPSYLQESEFPEAPQENESSQAVDAYGLPMKA